ncbi:MAG: ABC transporter ATP-binding protein [Clostridia bacterium]|nr:ABC transporter ATP-binding protein [Clostridia bacterium]
MLGLLNPILMAKIIDVGIKNSDKAYIFKFGAIILVCNILAFAFALICQKCASVASTGIATKIRDDMFETINNFSHKEIDNFGTSSLVTRLTNDVYKVKSLISVLIRVVTRTPFLLIGALILSIFINAKLSLIFCVVLPIIIMVLVYFTKLTIPYYKILRDKIDVVSKITRENLSGIRVVRAFNHQPYENKRFTTANHELTQDSIKVSKITSLLNPFIYLIVNIAIMCALYFGGIQVNIGNLTQGELIAFCNYFTVISVSLIQISNIYVQIVDSTASWHRIKAVLLTKPSVEFVAKRDIKIEKAKNKPILEFKNVGFSYNIDEKDMDRMFLKNISFKLMPKATLGIIGPTGSGKTTLINLIARFYDCNIGSVELFGKDIKSYSKKQLSKLVSITQQRSNLFSGSLKENMRLRDKTASDKEIIQALKTAQAWEFVERWPTKLNYQIMAGGKNVSGGQSNA